MNSGIIIIFGGAGFCPSTVALYDQLSRVACEGANATLRDLKDNKDRGEGGGASGYVTGF